LEYAYIIHVYGTETERGTSLPLTDQLGDLPAECQS
jgi:hypothetical protein